MTKRERSIKMIFNPIKFGNDIMARRLELKLTTHDIETLSGLAQSAIARYERGEEPNPKMQSFLAVCNAYDIDPREYFELAE